MTGHRKDRRDALSRLANALVEDILKATDQEIRIEFSENEEDLKNSADQMRVLFECTVLDMGKEQLAEAKRAVAEARVNQAPKANVDLTIARQQLESKLTRGPDVAARLTMAARREDGLSQRDIDSAIEDLAELGALDDEDDGK